MKENLETHFPVILLREKMTEKAFIRRACFDHFAFDVHNEENTGPVEYRPAKIFPDGTIYLG